MTEQEEVASLNSNPDVAPRGELPDGAALVAGAIAASTGGVNGLNPYIRLQITDLGGGSLNYKLTDRETGAEQNFLVTITPDEE